MHARALLRLRHAHRRHSHRSTGGPFYDPTRPQEKFLYSTKHKCNKVTRVRTTRLRSRHSPLEPLLSRLWLSHAHASYRGYADERVAKCGEALCIFGGRNHREILSVLQDALGGREEREKECRRGGGEWLRGRKGSVRGRSYCQILHAKQPHASAARGKAMKRTTS